MKVIKIATDNNYGVIDVESMDGDCLAEALECSDIDVTYPRSFNGILKSYNFSEDDDRVICMVYDLEAVFGKSKNKNTIATMLIESTRDNLIKTIYGDVLLVAVEFTDCTDDLVELTDSEVTNFLEGLNSLRKMVF